MAGLTVWVAKLPPTEQKGRPYEELTEVVTEYPGVRRTDFVDENGVVTFASDRKFATIIRELNAEGRNIRERYYDENGDPAIMWMDHYGLAFEYDEEGRSYKYTFLDAQGEPMMGKGEFSTVLRKYDSENRVCEEWYYDLDMQPVQRSGYYGCRYQRDSEGRTTETAYLDINGNVTKSNSGYAIERYTRDSEGKLLVTMYYDENGEPTPLGRWQYGVRYTDDGSIMLDKDGNELVTLNTFLDAHQWIVFTVGALLTLGVVIFPVRKGWRVAFVAVYALFIAYETLYRNAMVMGERQVYLFESVRQAFSTVSTRVHLVDNIWLFAPYGCGLYTLLKFRRAVVVVVASTLFIEGLQLVARLGRCDLSDVVCNSLGGLMGVIFAWAVMALVSEKFTKKI
ncbi:MAG: VanZ family protein [Saccharofermentans sp.]|nr:VanZ family protein [Saccharofermentans sp.]